MKYKRVLIPLDGSALAEQALPHARGMSVADLERMCQPTHTWSHEHLELLAADIRQQGAAVQKVTVDGHPHSGTAEFVDSSRVDLIVMSTRGQSRLSRWLMGSVADRVVRGATVPVLLVRTRKENEQRQMPAE